MTAARTVLEVELQPLIGSRFQPTGFPDLGAAEFGGTDGRKSLIVESVQSMANRLEATTWDDGRAEQADELAGLPYVRVTDPDGVFLSSSRLEAHRLASAYVMQGTIDGTRGEDWILGRLGLQAGRPLDHRAVARACFALDPVALVHGVFFARKGWPWQPRITRAVTAFIEAHNVVPVVSGGVKRDVVVNEAKDGATAEGYGTVPHHRVEYTAETIVASVAIDHAQIRSYGLSEAGTALLEAIVDYELGSLFGGDLRLRTACDLKLADVRQGEIPNPVDAAQRIGKLVQECGTELSSEPVTAVWSGRAKAKSKGE
jgi:CRISPR-associated protein Csb1